MSSDENKDYRFGSGESIDTNLPSIKSILSSKGYDLNNFYMGAALNSNQLGTSVETLFLNEFDYATTENSAKQSIYHPSPGTWNRTRVDAFLNFAKNNNITLRMHGPVGPQSSTWAKTDTRTALELETNMTEFLTDLSQRINNQTHVKWMDVVNETVNSDGSWFSDKSGTDQWENPWVKMGYNSDNIPNYIVKAFEIANTHATNISLIYNQHGGMESAAWDKIKSTILYLKNTKGLRVDGLGWQAHLKDHIDLGMDKEKLEYFSNLIDWAHTNGLDFHITEIDYRRENESNSAAYLRFWKVKQLLTLTS